MILFPNYCSSTKMQDKHFYSSVIVKVQRFHLSLIDLVCDFSGNVLIFSLMLIIGLLYYLYYVGVCPLYFSFSRIFTMKRCWVLSNAITIFNERIDPQLSQTDAYILIFYNCSPFLQPKQKLHILRSHSLCNNGRQEAVT